MFWTGGSDGQLRLWDVTSSAIIAKEPKSFNEQLVLHAQQERAKRSLAAGRADPLDDEETRAITAVHLVSSPSPCLVSVHADQNIVVRSVGTDDAAPLEKGATVDRV